MKAQIAPAGGTTLDPSDWASLRAQGHRLPGGHQLGERAELGQGQPERLERRLQVIGQGVRGAQESVGEGAGRLFLLHL